MYLMRCVTPGGYSGHYKGIEEGAAYCHTRSTTCHEQDEEEGRDELKILEKCRKNEENQEEPFLCFASSGRCCCGAYFSVQILCVFWAYLVCIMQDICCLVLFLDMAQYCSLQSSFRTFHSRSIAL